jgi:hypothetical protein
MAVYTTLPEVKAHLRVDFTDDDTYIGALQDLVEELVLTDIKGSITGEGTVSFASGSTSLSGIETNFMDFTSGDVITIEGDTIKYNLTIASIIDNDNLDFTSGFTTTEDSLAYTVNYGYPLSSGTLPLGLKHAMLLLIAHFYQNREPVAIGVNTYKLPLSYQYLIMPYKHFTIV